MVEPEGTTERLQPPADPDKARVLRQQIDRRGDVHEQHIERPVAAHLVGEIGPVDGTGVMGLRGSGHDTAQSSCRARHILTVCSSPSTKSIPKPTTRSLTGPQIT